MPKKIEDGLTKHQRYRLKDLDAYKKKKREYARTPEERAKRVAYMRIWREENRERHNELARQSHERNKHKHVEVNRQRRLKKVYGLEFGQYEKMLEAQDGKCFFCGGKSGKRRFHVDHCHTTGRVRMLLCGPCNGALGWYEIYKERANKYLGMTW